MLLRFLNIVFCLFWFNANSQDLDWVKPVTNDSFSNIGKVRITPDGDLLTLVNSYYYNRNDTLNHYRSTTTLEKFNSSGEKIWQLPINSSYKYSISDFETDSVGNIFLIGYFEKELHVDHVTEYTDSNAFFVAKFNSENEIIWFRKAFGLYFSTISLMPQGKVIISSFTSEIGVDLEKSDNVSDLAHYETEYRQGRGLTAYNAYDGNLLWSKFYGWDDKNSYAGVYKTQATRNGIYELVRWEGKIDVETGPGKTILETVDPSFILMNSFYISKYSPDGDLLWCKILERDSSSYFGEIENVYMDADNVGNIFLTGGFHGKVDFDFTGKEYTIIVKDQTHGFNSDYFFGKYDEDLNLKWIHHTQADYSHNSFVRRLLVKSTGKSVYLYGIHKPGIGIDFKNSDYKLLGNMNHFFAEYDMDGNLLTARNLGEENDLYYHDPRIMNFEVDQYKNIYLSGDYDPMKKFDFDPSQNSVFMPDSITNSTAFLARYQTCKKPVQIIPQYQITDCQEKLTTLYAQNDHFPVRWYDEAGRFLHEGISYTLPQINGATKITAEDGCGYRDEIEIERQNRWMNIQKIYPNPVRDKLTISLEGISDVELNLQLINALGQNVFTGKYHINNGFQNITMPVTGLKEGIYLLILQNNCIRQTEKIVIVK